MTYISFKELKFKRNDGSIHAICVDSDKTITVKTEDISAVYEEKLEYTYEVYCKVALSNGFKFSITKETGDTIREILHSLTTDISNRGE
jgi:hypothetical protein